MKVGGRDFNEDRHSVELAMRGETPEEIRKYLVEVKGQAFPPKQVLAHVMGWERQTFTTMEAQRVLNKIGFVCREAGTLEDGRKAWFPSSGKMPSPGDHLDSDQRVEIDADRISTLEAAVAAAHEAIRGLSARVRLLEDH